MRAVYLDSKIRGAIEQLTSYFTEGVFDKSKTNVIFKYYIESFSFYKKKLDEVGINYTYYKKINDLDLTPYEVVFYLFNAQSNCRVASYRNAKHIFVTHGESNKLASIKPIIRIYDYVVCAGDAGVHRYIENKIFTPYDEQTNRIVKLGDTFIGKSRFEKSEYKQNAYILYAPTWEGGVASEDYSSLSADLNSFKTIAKFAKSNNIKNIVIQPHPNTGHRDKKYKEYLEKGIKFLKDSFLNIEYINKVNNKNFFVNFIKKERKENYREERYLTYRAFIDISAMETQLLNECIPMNIFINSTKNTIVKKQFLKDYYEVISIEKTNKEIKTINSIESIRDFYISYSFDKLIYMTKSQRIDWLVEFTREHS